MAVSCLRVPMASCSIPSSSLSSFANSIKKGGDFRTFCSMKVQNSAKIPLATFNSNDPFIKKLSSVTQSPEMMLNPPKSSDNLPLLDLVATPNLMATPAQVERSVSSGGGEHRTRRPPPDIASLMLHSRIVYIGMPLVPAVVELVAGQLLYLRWTDPKEPIYLYINSTGTTRDDYEPISLESSGFAIYDLLMGLNCEIYTVGIAFALGHACLLLASGTKGKRFMFPDARATIQEPRVPASGLISARDVQIRAKEAMLNRQTLITLLAKHTGNSEETIDKVMRRGTFYMDGVRAKEFGVIDKILVRGNDKIMSEVASQEDWDVGADVRRADII